MMSPKSPPCSGQLGKPGQWLHISMEARKAIATSWAKTRSWKHPRGPTGGGGGQTDTQEVLEQHTDRCLPSQAEGCAHWALEVLFVNFSNSCMGIYPSTCPFVPHSNGCVCTESLSKLLGMPQEQGELGVGVEGGPPSTLDPFITKVSDHTQEQPILKKKKCRWQFSRVFQHHTAGKYPGANFLISQLKEPQPPGPKYPV